MADTQETVEVKFKFLSEGDAKVADTLKKFSKEGAGSVAIAEALRAKFADISRENKFNKIIQDAAALKNGLDGAEKSAQTLLDGLESIGATESEIAAAARKFTEFKAETAKPPSSSSGGNLNLGAIGRGLGAAGLGGVGEIANAIDDLSDLTKQVSGLGDAAKSAGGIGPLVTQLTGLGPVGIAAGIGIAAAAAAFVLVQKNAHDAGQEIRNELDARRQAADILKNATKEELQAKIEAAKKDVESTKAQLDNITYVREQGFKEAAQQFGDLGARALFAFTTTTNTQGVNDVQKEYEDLGKTLGTQEALVRDLEAAYKNNATAANDNEKAIEESTKAATENFTKFKKSIDDTALAIAAALKERNDIEEQIGDVEEKRAAQLANRLQDEKRSLEIGDLENQIRDAQNDEAEQDKKDKINELRAEGGDVEAQAIVKQNERIQQINDTFFANQTKAWSTYYKAETRADQQHKTDRIRQLEDLNSTLLNLSASRDVAGFINARTSGLTNIRRGDEDAGTASRQRLQDYEDSAREADANRTKQLNELRAANEKENTERRNALNKRIAEEEAAGQGQLKQSEVLQQQLADLRQRYAAEDLRARRDNEDRAYNEQIGKLKNRQAELNKIVGSSLDPARTSLVNLANGIVGFINTIRGAASAPAPRPASYSVGFGSGNNAYVPPPSTNRSATVIVQQANFGKVATPADVAEGQRAILKAMHLATGGSGL